MQIGDRDAGIHGVDAHAVRRHLERRAARQVIDARFADAVREDAGKRSQTVHARHIHDRALARLQVRQRLAHQPERRAQIDPHHRVPRRVGRVFDRAGRNHAGGVHEDVDPTKVVDRVLDNVCRRVLVGHVRRKRDGPSAGRRNLARHVGKRSGIPGDERDGSAFAANASAAARPMPLDAPVTITTLCANDIGRLV